MMRKGDPGHGAEQIRAGIARWEAAGGGALRLYLRSLLADALRRSADAAGAAELLRATCRELESAGCERIFESEVYRLQGEIHGEAGDTTQAEALLLKAAATAEAAGAPSVSSVPNFKDELQPGCHPKTRQITADHKGQCAEVSVSLPLQVTVGLKCWILL